MSANRACCGIACEQCRVYAATRQNDDALRREVAAEWSEALGRPILPEEIQCDGCGARGGRIFGYCKVCAVRQCALEQGVESCAFCNAYPCELIELTTVTMPYIRETLDAMRAKARKH